MSVIRYFLIMKVALLFVCIQVFGTGHSSNTGLCKSRNFGQNPSHFHWFLMIYWPKISDSSGNHVIIQLGFLCSIQLKAFFPYIQWTKKPVQTLRPLSATYVHSVNVLSLNSIESRYINGVTRKKCFLVFNVVVFLSYGMSLKDNPSI